MDHQPIKIGNPLVRTLNKFICYCFLPETLSIDKPTSVAQKLLMVSVWLILGIQHGISQDITILQPTAGQSVCTGEVLTLSVITSNPSLTGTWIVSPSGSAIVGDVSSKLTTATINPNQPGEEIIFTWNPTIPIGAESVTVVIDSTAPVMVGVPANASLLCENVPPLPAGGNGSGGAATGNVTATDDCTSDPANITIEITEEILGPCVNGNYTIKRTWKATDGTGNFSEEHQEISIQDNVSPSFLPVEDITIALGAEQCDTMLSILAIPTDGCSSVDVTYTVNGGTPNVGYDASGTYDVGSYTIVFIGSDFCGNQATKTVNVNITDSVAPTLTCPGDTTYYVANTCQAIVNYSIVVTDNCDDSITPNILSGPLSGTNKAIGVYPVSVQAQDNGGNMANCAFTITVADTTSPVILNAPADIAVSGNANCAANVTVPIPTIGPSGNFNDNCPGLSFSNDRTGTTDASDTYPEGITNVTWTIVDAAGNQSSVVQKIAVGAIGIPNIDCGGPDTVGTDSAGCVYTVQNIELDISAGDNCNTSIVNDLNNSSSLAGEVLAPGLTEVTWTASNGLNTASCTQQIIVADLEIPTMSCPDTVYAFTSLTECSGIANFSAKGFDNCDNSPVVTYDINPGSLFPGGINEVIATATDSSGNAGNCTIVVWVLDTVAPAFDSCLTVFEVVPDSGTCEAILDLTTPTATDNCSSATVQQTSGPTNGTLLQAGDYPIVFVATDSLGNSSTCEFTVSVLGNEEPVITCPDNFTLENDSSLCGAIVSFVADFEQSCSGNVTLSYSQNPGTLFSVGETIVTATATDNGGNSASCSFTVTVSDTEAPIIDCGDPDTTYTKSINTGNCTYLINGNELDPLSISDNCADITLVNSIGDSSSLAGIELPIGTSTILWTATDTSGNASTCSINVLVEGSVIPVLDCSNLDSLITRNTDSLTCAFVVNGTFLDPADVLSSCAFTLTNNINGLSSLDGESFDLGQHTILWTASNDSNQTSQCQFILEVLDDQAPEISCPENISLANDSSFCGANVVFAANFQDNCPGNVSVTYSHASGTFFPIGETLVNVVATDSAGNSDSCSFSITVADTEAPIIDCGNPNETLTKFVNNGNCTYLIGANELNPLSISDNCGEYTLIHSIGDSANLAGVELPLGPTTIVWTASDTSGNTSSCSINVVVEENSTPLLDCSNLDSLITKYTDSLSCEYLVSGSVLDPAAVPSACSFTLTNDINNLSTLDGESFGLGSHTITWTVTNSSNDSSQCQFTLEVLDGQSPEITCPENISVENDSSLCGAYVSFAATAQDNCSGNVNISYSQDPGTFFPVGGTVVDVVATDSSGNSASCSFSIIVSENEAPVIDCSNLGAIITKNTDDQSCEYLVNGTLLDPAEVLSVCSFTLTNNINGLSSLNGESFGLGSHTIIWTASNSSSQSSQCQFTLEILDVESPEITCPQNISSGTDAGLCTAKLTDLGPVATDNCSAVEITYLLTGATEENGLGPVDSLVFELGETLVSYTARDSAGNISTCSFSVNISDDEAPNAACPDTVFVSIDPGNYLTIDDIPELTNNHTDNCGISSIVMAPDTLTCSQIGPIEVNLQVSDFNSNTSSCTSTIILQASSGFSLTCPSDLIIEADSGQCAATVTGLNFDITASCDQVPTLAFRIEELDGTLIEEGSGEVNGKSFPVGISRVIQYLQLNQIILDSCEFTVRVNDTEAPIISCPTDLIGEQALLIEADTCIKAVQGLLPIFSDNCSSFESSDLSWILIGATPTPSDGNVGDASGYPFNVGVTELKYTLVDNAGNGATCSVMIEIKNTKKPQLDCPQDIVVEDIEDCTAVVEYPAITASDYCGQVLEPVQIYGFPSGTAFPRGNTLNIFEAINSHGERNVCSFTIWVKGIEEDTLTIAEINATDSLTICDGTMLDMTGNSPQGPIETGTWTSSFGVPIEPNDMDTSVTFINLPPGEHILNWTISDGCVLSADHAFVTVLEKPTGILTEVRPSTYFANDGALTVNPADGAPPYTFEWNTGSDSSTIDNIGQGLYWTIVTDTNQCASDTLFKELIEVPPPPVQLSVRAFLSGAYTPAGVMRTTLKDLPDFPRTEPYSGLGFYQRHGGGELLDSLRLEVEGDSGIVDWLLLELRDKNDPKIIRATKSVLLLANGQVTNMRGLPIVKINAAEGEYYIAVRHRNHLGIMSADPYYLSHNSSTNLDFSFEGGNATYGQLALSRVENSSNLMMWGGNSNGDNRVIFVGGNNDISRISALVFTHPSNLFGFPTFPVQGYHVEDLNMDGRVIFVGANNEVFLLSSGIFTHPGNLFGFPTYPIIEQLPE